MDNYKITVPRRIIFLTVFIILLVLGYTIWSDTSYFLYLIWNIFLAFLPFFISANLLKYQSKGKTHSLIIFGGLLVWLILFPNAPYLVTDIIHLSTNVFVPFWYDVLLLFSSAWLGVYIGVHSLFQVEQIFLLKYSKIKTDVFILLTILLSSFGIYMGRFLRWNSWDVFIQPRFILKDSLDIFYHPFDHPEAYITTLVFFVFITVSYNVWKHMNSSSKLKCNEMSQKVLNN